MSSENKIYTLEEITTLITDGKHGDCQDLAGSGYYFLSVKDVKGDRLNYEQARQITKKDFEETHRRTNLEPGDILFTNTGTIGRMAIASANELTRRTTFQKSVAILKPKIDLVISRYLFYLLKAENRRLSALAEGTTQKNLLLKDFRSFEIGELPPVKNQQAIAHILGTLDDKIELNRKTNETLEAIAKALFKSWFVDFDPVRAKAEGRPTGLPAEISDLFPDSFEESELGEIPSGWSVEELGNLYTIGKGGIWGDDTCSGDEFTEVSCLRGIDCHNLASGSIPVVPSRWVKRSQVESRIPEDGAILIEGSGSFCGRSLLWEEKYLQLFERAVVYSNFCKRLSPTCSKIYSPVVWMALRGCYDSNEVANFRTGTAFPNLDTSGLLKGISIVLPSEGVAEAFQDSYYLRNRVDLMAQSASLSNIRDALLPKLISGEIRISDAEKMLEEVGI
jgi:type I restriction enzyme S subunit